MSLDWKIGLEVELLAPRGLSRQTLAEAIAHRCGGRLRRFFHPQAEPSKVPGKPVFQNLTLGFEVLDATGHWLVRCVDDLTLQDDLDSRRPAWPGWYRIVSDDIRLLRLVQAQCDPGAVRETVLTPVARLFHTRVETNSAGMARVADHEDAAIAIAAPLPGERERPCELIVAPVSADHRSRWGEHLALARDLGFALPAEGATHLHFDATPLCSAPVLAALVRLLDPLQPCLRRMMATNPRCRRLGAWPPALLERVSAADFAGLSWSAARAALRALPLTKYCDINLLNLIHATPEKHTLEIRILPALLDVESIEMMALLWQGLLRWILEAGPGAVPPDPQPAAVLALAGLPASQRGFWSARLTGLKN